LLVRFNPRDAVSVPQDCECQKLRVCKYEGLEEIEVEDDSEIKEPYYGVYTNGDINSKNDYDEDYDDYEDYEDEEN
jgi:hypothetical protein